MVLGVDSVVLNHVAPNCHLWASWFQMSRTAPPQKISNQEKRTREHLLPSEVEAMVKAAHRVGRHGLRDSTLILLAYRHGLRVSELVGLKVA